MTYHGSQKISPLVLHSIHKALTFIKSLLNNMVLAIPQEPHKHTTFNEYEGKLFMLYLSHVPCGG